MKQEQKEVIGDVTLACGIAIVILSVVVLLIPWLIAVVVTYASWVFSLFN